MHFNDKCAFKRACIWLSHLPLCRYTGKFSTNNSLHLLCY